MKRTWTTIALSLCLSAAACDRAPRANGIFSMNVPTAAGELLDLSSLGDNSVSVFSFLAPDCPLSQNYTLTLDELTTKFASDHVRIYGVISGGWFDEAEVDEFVTTYGIDFPVLLDDDYVLANLFGATVTPEAFAMDPEGRVLYSGAIDNWAGELGQHRTVITDHYLRDAIASILSGATPEITKTQAIGCYLERL
jgi:peroxiredoxin